MNRSALCYGGVGILEKLKGFVEHIIYKNP